jgi:hypothetical protein
MSKGNGFLQLRRGLWEHLRDGRVSPTAGLAFIYICSQADTRSGSWRGSAGALAGELGLRPRTARNVLERLERGHYIRRFGRPGERFCYPILVHKFQITQGDHDGEVVNALSSAFSNGCLDLKYFPREVHGEVDVKVDVEVRASQRRIENRKQKREKKNLAAKPTPPPDPRFKTFFNQAYEVYRARNGQPPTWGGKDRTILKQFLAEQPHITPEEWERRCRNYLDSTERFIRSQGGSLAYFANHFDSFANGPILEKVPVGGSSGKGVRSNSAAVQAATGKYDQVHVQRFENNGKLPPV